MHKALAEGEGLEPPRPCGRTVFWTEAVPIMLIPPYGGEGGVRTHAPLTRPNGLANRPLYHLGTPP